MAYHLDYETTSKIDIKKLGGYRYANDPSTRILMFAIAKDDGEPVLWDHLRPKSEESKEAMRMFRDAIHGGDLIYAHNVGFELAITHYRGIPDLGLKARPLIDQWRCTQAMTARAALPVSLGEAAKILNLDVQKAKVGLALIHIFSDQTKETTLKAPKGVKEKNWKTASPLLETPIPWDWLVRVDGDDLTVREAYDLFCEYCRQDVRVEQKLHKTLKHFELKGDELASFQFDLRMNFKGVPVNIQALKNAKKLVDQFNRTAETRCLNLCGLRPSQGKALLSWLKSQGYRGDNLQAATVEEELEDTSHLTKEGAEVLQIKAYTSFAALKKIDSMLGSACDDGNVRGTTKWHGTRTGRASGQIIQPQNIKKATIPDSKLAYQMICDGAPLEDFEDFWGSPLEAVASCARHFIQFPDSPMLDADYKSVEALITPWIAGAEKKLESILRGEDQYKLMASRLFKVPYDKVQKWQRTIAKPVELGCCFGVGGKGLRTSLAAPPYKVDRTLKECREYVKVYREANPETVQAWADIEFAAKNALKRPGAMCRVCRGMVGFRYGRIAGIPYLEMTIPSGRQIYYPFPKVVQIFKKYDEEEMAEDPWKAEKKGYYIDEITFFGKLQNSGTWGRVQTWGSRLFENIVQATGADLLHYGCIQAEREGYDIRLIVHDQALAKADKPLDGFVKALCRKQPWAETFPLQADGAVVPFYLKDD